MEKAPSKSIRFIDSMPRPLLVVFLLFVAAGIGLVVYLLGNPPTRSELPLAERRSPPKGSFTHDVVRARLVDIPSPLPSFRPPCEEVRGLVVEGGPPAVARLIGPDEDGRPTPVASLCGLLSQGRGAPVETQEAIRGLAKARIRFALFTRTGVLSTTDLSENRILLAVALSRTNLPPLVIAPLLAHEGYHIAKGGPVTATQEFAARVAELGACRNFFKVEDYPRGCADADAIVRLGRDSAVELLVRAGFPR
ncbi:MAG: hypothetical protein WAT66_03315 [Actinomycetota bacterium]